MIDFIEFCKKFSIPFNHSVGIVNIMENKFNPNAMKKILGLKTGKTLTVGHIEYIINPEKDYYRGIHTILTSEVAALVKAEEIFHSINDGELFFD